MCVASRQGSTRFLKLYIWDTCSISSPSASPCGQWVQRKLWTETDAKQQLLYLTGMSTAMGH